MKTRRLPDQRKFTSLWDEIKHLYDRLLYWLYRDVNGRKALSYSDRLRKACPYAERLAQLLADADPNHDTILGEECWSLVFETKGDLQKAIRHRENEIKKIRNLQKISKGTPGEQIVLDRYGIDALSDRLDLLAILQHDNNELDKAINTLLESKYLCERHRIKFDGEDILYGYLEKKKISGNKNNFRIFDKIAFQAVSGDTPVLKKLENPIYSRPYDSQASPAEERLFEVACS